MKNRHTKIAYQKFELLSKILQGYRRVAIAFSGGLDSTVLLYFATKILGRKNVLPLTIVSPIFLAEDLARAKDFALNLKTNFKTIPFDHLSWQVFSQNPPDRCYHCKYAMYKLLLTEAYKEKFFILADGTQADDLKSDRPGLKAIHELGIMTPLAQAGLTKAELRIYARNEGLKVAEIPAAPCLATRFPSGEVINSEKLKLITKAEKFIRSKGFKTFRVRFFKGEARLEFHPSEFELFWQKRMHIFQELKSLGFSRILLDLEGYRSIS